LTDPAPLLTHPIYKPRPWGGRALATLLKRSLPDGPIGESWEVADLPGDVSVIRGGALDGRSIREAIQAWGPALMGRAALHDGAFPLLVKYLDAREDLSVQVHPRPDPSRRVEGIKHESWFVLDAQPGSAIYVGARPGVTLDDFRRAGATPGVVDLLVRRPVRGGDCFYLPSGTPHALGAGVVVAEVQTPSDVTYRLYDWGRVGLDGKPRELHGEAALANLVCDVPESQIVQPRSHSAGAHVTVSRLVACEKFSIDRVRLAAAARQKLPHEELAIWMIFRGGGAFLRGSERLDVGPGDTAIVPAVTDGWEFEAPAGCELLEVRVPPAGMTP
jgi:mannose-6-phosphate isomerase